MRDEAKAIGSCAVYQTGQADRQKSRPTRSRLSRQTDIPTTVAHYAYVRELHDSLKERITALGRHVESLSYQILPTLFMNQNVKTITLPDIGRVTIKVRWSATMLNKQGGMDWLRSTGNSGLIIDTVNARTLTSFAQAETLAGHPLPEDLFKAGDYLVCQPHQEGTRTRRDRVVNAPLKPHLKLKAIPMANDLDTPRAGGIPDFLRRMSTGTSFGNIDASDLKPPRLKVLAGQSPEVTDGVPGAQPGNLWLTVLNLNLGQSVIGSPILLRKTYQVWAPKTPGSEQKGPLATASDGISWDVPNQTFEIKFPMNPRIYTWKLGRTVAETGAHKFGSSQDDDPKSKPIAALTYDILWLIDLPNGQKQLAVFTARSTGIKPTQTFISTVAAIGIDQMYQRYRIVVQKKTGPTGDPYFSFDYQYVGNIESEEEAATMRGLYDSYAKSGFIADTEDDGHAPQHKSVAQNNDDIDSVPF